MGTHEQRVAVVVEADLRLERAVFGGHCERVLLALAHRVGPFGDRVAGERERREVRAKAEEGDLAHVVDGVALEVENAQLLEHEKCLQLAH